MSNRNWVCFNCRITNRKQSGFSGRAVCSDCGGELINIGYRIPVPPKSKIKEWKKLKEQLAQQSMKMERLGFEHSVRFRHDLEKEITKLKNLPQSPGRQSLIKQIEAKLKYT